VDPRQDGFEGLVVRTLLDNKGRELEELPEAVVEMRASVALKPHPLAPQLDRATAGPEATSSRAI
jgi:hypothetical protein